MRSTPVSEIDAGGQSLSSLGVSSDGAMLVQISITKKHKFIMQLQIDALVSMF